MNEVAVLFQPSGKTVHVLSGTRLTEAAAMAGLVFDSPCGGEGTCGKCRVVVHQGACPPVAAEIRHISPEDIARGTRLACQTAVAGPMVVETPAASLLGSQYKILTEGKSAGEVAVEPAVRKQYVELSPPERGRDESDAARLMAAAGPLKIELDLLRQLPRLLRENDFRGTAVAAEGRLLDFEPGNTQGESFAVAVDVGTTTLVAMLVDLTDGGERAVVARLNPQTSYGDDVLTRILHSQQAPAGLENLLQAVVSAVDAMIGELTATAGIDRRRIYEVVLSGNTTMQQLLLGLDPRSLGEVPFVPAASERVETAAAELGISIHPRGRAYVLPVIGGFVGGDTVAGILASNLAELPGPTVLVDIGTNGEIVLAVEGKLTAASTAAGPAFEGARISQGMRAGAGAIEKVVVQDGRLRINVIGDVRPVGLCGSALIDAAAECLRHGVLTPEGRLPPPGELPDSVPDDLARRVRLDSGKPVFVLAEPDQAGGGRAVVLTQRDFRELQLASGAIRAGIRILLKQAGLKPENLDAVLVAGGFGNFIRRNNAQRIGLLPHEVPRNRIRYLGNTSLAGARLAALSIAARRRAEELARRTAHVDLSTDPDFRWAFAEAMLFPSA